MEESKIPFLMHRPPDKIPLIQWVVQPTRFYVIKNEVADRTIA